jgi:lipopolysaccharide/colanic/teichoic acid biosynthesis glycosyltransferase
MIVEELPPRTATRERFPDPSPHPGSDRLKRACDLLASLAISVVAVPVIAAAWVVVRLTSSGPGFYSQLRVGRHGRVFRIYKIRTMYHNCEAVSGPKWSTKHDPRVTFVGRILRKLHIDELPQLLNVLRGDMSLVGPRPERPEFVGVLAAKIPGYAERLAVRPGVTGLAQIQLPPDTDLDSVRRKLMFDQCYIRTGGIWLDVRIMLGTLVYLVGFPYTAVRKAMRLPNPLADSMADTVPDLQIPTPFRTDGKATEPNKTPDRSPGVEGAPVPCNEAR